MPVSKGFDSELGVDHSANALAPHAEGLGVDLLVSWGWTTMLMRLHPMQKALGLIPELREDKEVSLNYSVSTEWNPVCSVKDKHLSALDTHFVA